jgi:N-dimethylarginine dimethylaminohydrolase
VLFREAGQKPGIALEPACRAPTSIPEKTIPMTTQPIILVVDPAHFNVSYVINPWMRPGEWAHDPEGHQRTARASFDALCGALAGAGARVEVIPGVAGLPDMVFPANAAVVLDRRALVARFACAERQGEEAPFRAALQGYVDKGILDEVSIFPEHCFQEGAGDAIWDRARQLFWAGHGQRSVLRAADELRRFFGRTVMPLHLATPRFYHLDTCFCPLSGGEVLFFPPAFTSESLAHIHQLVAPDQRLEASEADAAAFCVNAVCIDRTVIMARAPDHVRGMLSERGYTVIDINLDPYILSGGGAYCMTLRLDRSAGTAGPGEEAVLF